jgi:hypothetical protein
MSSQGDRTGDGGQFLKDLSSGVLQLDLNFRALFLAAVRGMIGVSVRPKQEIG